MKKILTFCAAVLASLTMMAQTTLATFEVTLTADPTGPYASYEDDDATYTCYKVGGSGSNFYKASDNKYYLKLTGDDASIQIKLKSGSFAADDIVYYALNHSSKKTGIGFKFGKSNTTTTADMTAAGTEVIGQYTLTAADIEEDGSIKMLRVSSNTFVNRIYVNRPAAETNPVAEVTIAGPARGTASYAAEFTASTDIKADAYQWFVNDAAQEGATAKTFEFTPAAAGDYSIVCKARNANNATGEWIASKPIAFKALSSLCGELIKAVHTGKTTATVTGLIGGTADKSTESGGKINSNGYFGIQLASGNFQEGDTLVVNIGAANSSAAVLIIYAESTAENVILNTGVAGVSGDNKFVLPAAVNGKNALYIVRTADNAWNAVVNSISVIRPMAVKSTAEEFKGATINGDALNVSDFIELEGNQRVNVLETSYVEAPVVVFTKTVTTTYEDDSKTTKDVEVEVTAFNPTDTERWQARTTINGVDYVVSCSKTASVVVTYMDGETVLGTENVAANGNPANYLLYQSKNLAAFVGWYSNADLADEHAVADMSAEVISKATTYYAKFENKYAESVNIEKLILENGKGYDVVANALNGTHGYASNYTASNMDITSDSLDTYEKKGAMRNYAYLGLKIKSKSLLNCRVAQGQTILIKFGELKATPQVSVNGSAYAPMPITNGVCTYTATGDDLLSMYVPEDGKAVVLKQIMIGEAPALEDVVYDINCGEVQNGTLSCNWAIALPDETVALTVTPAEGYKVAAVTVNGETVEAVEGAYSFIMPAAAAAVSATFVEDTASALGNTEAETKAVKVVRDGQLLILKNGVLYNAQGAIVK